MPTRITPQVSAARALGRLAHLLLGREAGLGDLAAVDGLGLPDRVDDPEEPDERDDRPEELARARRGTSCMIASTNAPPIAKARW